MKRTLVFLFALAALSAWPFHHHRIVLYAQSVPATVTASWNANPAGDNVTAYLVSLDGGAVITVLPASCTATCSTPLTLPTFGPHTYTVVAQNASLTGGAGVTGTAQNSAAASLSFSLNQKPATPSTPTVK